MAECRWVRHRIHQVLLRSEHHFQDPVDPLVGLRNDQEVKKRFCFYRHTIFDIYGQVKPYIERVTERSCALKTMTILCVALRFFAEGPFYLMLADWARINRASVGRCVQVVNYALRKLAKKYIHTPDAGALPIIKEQFYQKAGW